jgi:hypothetical protein
MLCSSLVLNVEASDEFSESVSRLHRHTGNAMGSIFKTARGSVTIIHW